MSNENVDLIRRAYEAYSRGDVAAMLQFVDADLEWTYLDPSLEDPEPQVCHGRHELETALVRRVCDAADTTAEVPSSSWCSSCAVNSGTRVAVRIPPRISS